MRVAPDVERRIRKAIRLGKDVAVSFDSTFVAASAAPRSRGESCVGHKKALTGLFPSLFGRY